MEELSFSHTEKIIENFLINFNPDEYLYLDVLYRFEEEDIGELLTTLHGCKLPKKYHSYKDLLHEKLAQKLSLTSHDLFLYTNGVIYAKLFFQVNAPENSTDRRACGVPKEKLEAYKKQFFPNNEYKERMLELLSFAEESTLSIKKINPSEFRSLFIPVLVNIADTVVIESSELEDLQEIRGLSHFLLREMFEKMMLYIAEVILFHFSNQEKKAIDFLSHFGIHETIDAKGNRYKPNPILDESNRAWNMTTIRSTMIQHKKSKQTLYDKRNDLISIKKKLDTYKNEYKEVSKHLQKENTEFDETDEKLDQIHQTIDRLQYTEAKEVKFLENGEEKLFDRKSLIAQLFRKEDSLVKQKAKLHKLSKELELALSNKQKEINTWEKKFIEAQNSLTTLESHGHPIDAQYERIQRALAKTLSQR
ncbi:coiled-coil domain-containing protein [Sulfurospirillum sp.]|uniref:coiled-coil domain-containing protein n=1 Tax=Sulfurospirillum sp. TaxID=2053622 RepID=UPI002FDDB04F